MTTVVEKDLSEYTGKKVIVTVNLKEANEKGELAEEREGKAESANALGILFKPKGRTGLELIEIGDIEDVRLAPETDKKLTRRQLKIVELGQAKAHLLDRHGLTLAEVNGLDEEQAFTYHESLDHEALDLGHVHTDKDAEDRAKELEEKAEAASAE
jgi:hypothetical protein